MDVRIESDVARAVSDYRSSKRNKFKHALKQISDMEPNRLFSNSRLTEVDGQDEMFVFRMGDLRLYLSRTSIDQVVVVDVVSI